MRNLILFLLMTSLSSCGIFNTHAANKQNPHPNSKTNAPKTSIISQTADDIRISAGIHIDLYALDLFKPIDVKVKNGVVYYTGTVASVKDSFAASGVAWKQNGVKKVVNNLTIQK